MKAQQILKRIAGLLLVATIICAMILPSQSGMKTITAILAGIAALTFLVLLIKDRRKRGILATLMTLALVLLLGSGSLMGLTDHAERYELKEGSRIELAGFGMNGNELLIEDVNGRPVTHTKVAVALTIDQNITIHQTLTQAEPMYYHGVQINLVENQGEKVTLLVKYNPFGKMAKIGGILLVACLFLKAISAGKKKKGVTADA